MVAACLLYPQLALTAPQTTTKELRTEHLDIRYPAVRASELDGLLRDAEAIYRRVNEFFEGALPSPLTVTVAEVEEASDGAGDLRLSLRYAPALKERFALGLSRLAATRVAGAAQAHAGARFLIEGLSAWVMARTTEGKGWAEGRWRWAAYGYMQEAAYLEFLESFEGASEEVGQKIVVALGFTLVDVLVEHHGREAVVAVLEALPRSADVCVALDRSGVGCEDLLDRWWAALAVEASRPELQRLPSIRADLHARADGPLRALTLHVHISNPERETYVYYVHLRLGNTEWEEPYVADDGQFEAWIDVGTAEPGAKVLWNLAVWSERLEGWIRAGWQDRTVP